MPGICISGTSSWRTPKVRRCWKERISASMECHCSFLQKTATVCVKAAADCCSCCRVPRPRGKRCSSTAGG
eukprot:1138409-Heterocapsa_arctica.AAC.1